MIYLMEIFDSKNTSIEKPIEANTYREAENICKLQSRQNNGFPVILKQGKEQNAPFKKYQNGELISYSV